MHLNASTGSRPRLRRIALASATSRGSFLVSSEAATARDHATGRLENPNPSPNQAPLLPRPFFSAARRRASASAPPCSCALRGADDVIDALEYSRILLSDSLGALSA